MADRLNQYPMMPPTFNSAMLQQQHSQQTQQQSQGDSHATVQGISNLENSRMWQAMQQQVQQNQYRGQNIGEMAGSQQMTDLLRSRSLASVQGQQISQQQQQQQFGLSSSQMNAPGQHPGFHDQHQQSGQQVQPQMPSFGSNMSIPNTAQLQANFNGRNAMLHPFNQGSMSRQLELMGLAQNHQHPNPQANPANVVARMAQQQQQQQQQQDSMNGQPGQSQQGQSTLFSSPVMPVNEPPRASPSHPPSQTPGSMANQQGGLQSNGQGMPPGRRPMTFLELKERAAQIQTFIAKQEAMAMDLNKNRLSIEPTTFIRQMQMMAADVRTKKELLSKLVHAMNQTPQGLNNANNIVSQGGNTGNIQGMSASPGPQQHQQAGPSGQNQPPWMAQQGSAQTQGFPMGRVGPQLPARGPSQPHLQPSPQLHPSGPMQQSNPQRPGSTSRQLLAPPLPNQMSPSMSNQFAGNQFPAQNTQNMPQFALPPPLDKAKFEESYTAFCSTRPMMRDERSMQVGGRPVDLHALHYNVLLEGGAAKVTSRDMWPVIGARMGFVQFPGTDTEPAKSEPTIAQQLQHIHKEYLGQFDKIYIHSVLQKKGFFPPQLNNNAATGPQGNNSAGSPQVTNVPVPMQGNNGASGNNMPGASQVSMMNAVMGYANISASELRGRGIPDQIINFVEQNRVNLQRTSQQQQLFRGMVQKPNMSGQASEPGRMNPDVLGSFPNTLPAQQHGSMPPTGSRAPPPRSHPSAGMNVTGANNGQAQPSQKPLPNNGMVPVQGSKLPRPTPAQSQEALQFIQRTKNEFISKNLPVMKQHQVPETQRGEYSRILEQAHRHAQEVEHKLPMYFYVLKDPDMIRKLIAIIYTTREQRNLISTGTQRFILPLNTLSTLIAQVQQYNAQFAAATSGYMSQTAGAPPANVQSGSTGPPQRTQPPQQSPPQPPQQPPQQLQTTHSLSTQAIPQSSGPPPPGNRSIHLNPPPPPKKKPQQPALNAVASAAASTPTPPASTPAASAATPATSTAASPKTPKSPKGKAATKPKPHAQSKRKTSKVVAPTLESVQPTAPSPTLKRPREEEEPRASTDALGNAPSPKKAKTEWEGERNEALIKKEEQINNIKTDEDASAFLEQMTELIRLAAGNDGQESLTSDISETLDMILKGCGQDSSDPGVMAPLSMGDIVGGPSSSSGLMTASDEFQFKDFLDFTSCAAEDDYSKPTTPDLVVSSSTNPSPESASDPAEAAGHAATNASSDAIKPGNFKLEDSYDSDPLRLGVWKEIDGGESAYYQSDKWNWEGTMSVLDQPWAFAS